MMTMATLTRSVTVHAPVEKVFDYAMDVRNLWSFPGEAIALADVDLKPEGVGTSARIWSHWLGFHIEGGLEYTEVVRPERIVVQVGFAVEHPTWTFTFKPFHGGTKVTGNGEWHVSAPLVGKRFEQMAVKEHEPFLEAMLANLKAGVETKAA
jgi:uncharacterized protein YndB with AHSA1/START domain